MLAEGDFFLAMEDSKIRIVVDMWKRVYAFIFKLVILHATDKIGEELQPELKVFNGCFTELFDIFNEGNFNLNAFVKEFKHSNDEILHEITLLRWLLIRLKCRCVYSFLLLRCKLTVIQSDYLFYPIHNEQLHRIFFHDL